MDGAVKHCAANRPTIVLVLIQLDAAVVVVVQ